MVQALRLNTLSKLTFADSKRFDSLVGDVFPGVPIQEVRYAGLEAALRESCKELNLLVIESQVRTHMHAACACGTHRPHPLNYIHGAESAIFNPSLV